MRQICNSMFVLSRNSVSSEVLECALCADMIFENTPFSFDI